MFCLCYRFCILGVFLEMVYKEVSCVFVVYEIIVMFIILMILSIYVYKYD